MAVTIGITGGIGSGKTTVCKVFRLLGAPVFEADDAAKKLYDTDAEIRSELIQLFGESIYNTEGYLYRKKLASLIFNDDNLLEKVNRLVHPAVRREYQKWLEEHKKKPYVIHEAAILFESGFYKMMDFTILVTADKEQRIARVVKRDGVSRQMVLRRMEKQWSEEKKAKLADRVLLNDNKNLILPEIISIDKNLRKNGTIW